MGVRGLKSFIDNNKSDLLVNYHLNNTPLVIDGNNLQFSLYWKSSNETHDYIYGGDYSRYASIIRLFFASLFKCNVKPIVIFDGGIDPSQRKLKTMTERFEKCLDAVRHK